MIPDRAPLSGSRWSHTSALSCHPRMVEGVGKWKVGCTSNWCNQQETLVSYGFTWFLVNADRVLLKKIQTPAIQNWMCLTMIAENNYHWKNLDGIVQNWPKIRVFWASSSDQTRNPQRWRTPLRAGWRRPWPWHIDQFSGSRGSSDASNPRAGIPPGTILFAILGVYPLLLQKWLKLPVFLHFFCGWNQSLAVKRPPPALPKAPRPLSHRRTCSKVKPYLTGSFTTRKVCLVEPTIIGIY